MRVFRPERFGVVSVLVIDYRMPEMNGLTLCKRIAHLPCKKLLLTGETDKSIAIEAFNQGLIDLFLTKPERDLGPVLLHAVEELRRRYFNDISCMLSGFLMYEDPAFWGNLAFAQLLAEICRERGIVEYYAVSDPSGFLLVDLSGEAQLLLFFTDAQIEAESVAAAAVGAPSGVIARMQCRHSVPFIGDDRGMTVLTQEQWWRACVQLHPVPGLKQRYYGFVDNPAPFIVSPEAIVSFKQYMESKRREE